MDKETLLWMMQGADEVHIYVASGVFHFNALYKPAGRFPAARIYYLKAENLLDVGSIGVLPSGFDQTLPSAPFVVSQKER